MTRPALHAEALRLRVEERRSLAEIQAALGVSRSTLSLWLRSERLRPDEIAERMQRRRPGPARKCRGEQSKHHRALGGRSLTGAEKGRIAEAAVYFRLVLRDFAILRSPYDGAKVDFFVQPPGGSRWLALQVRWVKEGRSGLPGVKLVCSAGRKKFRRYTDDEFDAIVGYDLFTDTAYVFLRADVSHLRGLVTVADRYAEAWDRLLGV